MHLMQFIQNGLVIMKLSQTDQTKTDVFIFIFHFTPTVKFSILFLSNISSITEDCLYASGHPSCPNFPIPDNPHYLQCSRHYLTDHQERCSMYRMYSTCCQSFGKHDMLVSSDGLKYGSV